MSQRLLVIEHLWDGRFRASIHWMPGQCWERISAASFNRFPVLLCRRLTESHGDNWTMEVR